MVVKVKSLSRVRLFETPWTIVYQAPPSMGGKKTGKKKATLFKNPIQLIILY